MSEFSVHECISDTNSPWKLAPEKVHTVHGLHCPVCESR